MSVSIIPYETEFDASIRVLEAGITQGSSIRLSILKKHFLDRATVFKKWRALLAVNERNEVIGTTIGAATTLIVNGDACTAGIAFDTKVHENYRSLGIGRQLSTTVREWFLSEGWKKNFITLKISNNPVVKLVARTIKNFWLTEFVYLTIPTRVIVPSSFERIGNDRFFVSLTDQAELDGKYFTRFSGGPGCFYTSQLYTLKIDRLSPVYKLGLSLLKSIRPSRYASLPGEGEYMEHATLYDHSETNITSINDVLRYLEKQGTKFLLVCCQKGDNIYRYLKSSSVNTYGYYIMTDFPLSSKDTITIDVRCL